MDQEKRARRVGNMAQQATAVLADATIIARKKADDGLIYALSSDASLHTSVQQLIQQHRRSTARIGDTQPTPSPGNEHVENTSEQEQTIPTVSRIRPLTVTTELVLTQVDTLLGNPRSHREHGS